MLGRQTSDERLYMKIKDKGRGLKSLKEVFDETSLRVGYYMFVSQILGGSRRLGNKKQENSVTQLRIKQY